MANIVFHPSIAYVEPMPTAQALEDHYKRYFSTNLIYSQGERQEEIVYRQAMATLKLAMIEDASLVPMKSASLLEIGYGQGDFLAAALQKCNTVNGIDFTLTSLRPDYAHLRNHCLEGNPTEILQAAIRSSKKYDIINATHVLEHSDNPCQLLGLLGSLLHPESLLIVEIPNDFSPLQQTLKSEGLVDSDYWVSIPDHLCYWNKQRFSAFVTEQGMRICDAFGDFPIELFLLTEDFNYKRDSKLGKPAHIARCQITGYMVDHVQMPDLLNLSRALYACDVSRSYTYLLRLA